MDQNIFLVWYILAIKINGSIFPFCYWYFFKINLTHMNLDSGMLWLSFLYSWPLDSKSLKSGGIALNALYTACTSGPWRGVEVTRVESRSMAPEDLGLNHSSATPHLGDLRRVT